MSVDELRPDLIILDYRLPNMSRAEIITRLRADHPDCRAPVLFLTASVMPQQVAMLRQLGAAEVLAKPFDPVQLPQQLLRTWTASRVHQT